MRRIWRLPLACVLGMALMLPGCEGTDSTQAAEDPATQAASSRQADEQAEPKEQEVAQADEQGSLAQAGSDMTIDVEGLGQGVTFVPYDEEGSKVQLLLARVGDDVSVKLDTCNSCNGSPKAYYAYDGADTITCQNCGFEFAIDELDQRQGGCSPMDVDHEIVDGQVRVTAETLAQARLLFAKIAR